MNASQKFEEEKKRNIDSLGADGPLQQLAFDFMRDSSRYQYTYNFTWLGRPIIQYPQDILAMQELVWSVKPDLIIETGIAHGGSLVLSASLLQLIGGEGKVLGIDIDIRKHNYDAIMEHPMADRITMIQGSSIDIDTVNQVKEIARGKKKVMVILDSNHTHEHVLAELNLYAGLVTVGSYLIVFDTAIEDMPKEHTWTGRQWGKGNNPKTAVWEFMKSTDSFEIDRSIHQKLLITVAPDGYLRRVK